MVNNITPICWRLARCHRVLPSQVSYGLICWVGAGIKYSELFVCICKHAATRIRIWRGCSAEIGNLTVSVSWLSALHCNPYPTPCSPGHVPTPTPATLMAIPPSSWSANVYSQLKGHSLLRKPPTNNVHVRTKLRA